jgi:hypothetical protein
MNNVLLSNILSTLAAVFGTFGYSVWLFDEALPITGIEVVDIVLGGGATGLLVYLLIWIARYQTKRVSDERSAKDTLRNEMVADLKARLEKKDRIIEQKDQIIQRLRDDQMKLRE